MAEQLHRIKRQIIELNLSKKEATPAFYAEWRRLYDRCIVPLIESCCSELVGSDQIIRIDRLELNLGELDFENLEADLQAKIRLQLRQMLSEHLQVSAAEDAKQKNSSAISSHVELLTLFARQGILPWWADASKPTLLEDAMEALRKESGEVLRGLLTLLFQELTALKRIVRHFDDDTLQGLCLLSQSTPTSLFENTRKTMLVLLGSSHLCRSFSSGQLRNILWDAILVRSYLTESHSSSTPLFLQDVLSHLAGHIVVSSTVLMAELKQGFSLIAAPLDPAVFNLFERLFSKMQALDALQPKRLPLKPTDEITQDRHDVVYGDADEIYIENAGLILLWPFLTQFFKHMKFIGKEGFNDHSSLHRAVLLLQHIVTEQIEPAEYQLGLNRILCGMDLATVFEQDDPVSEAETLECQEFLEAVIAQVPVLKNMSVRGFRGTFLIRKGVLSIRDGLWLLRVERNDFDVVLDQFPWSVGWVKLPYMSQSMQVEW